MLTGQKEGQTRANLNGDAGDALQVAEVMMGTGEGHRTCSSGSSTEMYCTREPS